MPDAGWRRGPVVPGAAHRADGGRGHRARRSAGDRASERRKGDYDFLGSPEGELALAQAVVYLATAPKSNGVYVAYKAAMRAAKEHGSLAPPQHILNAPTKLMDAQGYGEGYQYDHDAPDGFSGQDYFPEAMGRRQFYTPPERGFEREIVKRLAYWTGWRKSGAGDERTGPRRLLVCWAGLIAATPAASAQADVSRLVAAYPQFLDRIEGNDLI